MSHHIISWSGGKDSTATVLLFKEHYNELVLKGDKVSILFSEVMFDKKNDVSGHNPRIIEFIKQKAQIFRKWGFNVEILRSDKDYLDVFYHQIAHCKNEEEIGKTHGFPLMGGMCAIKRDCKLKPIEKWLKSHKNEQIIQYVGIAKDEPLRLSSLHKKAEKTSLLEKYGYTEDMAMELCEKYDMVSPQYDMANPYTGKTMKRDGCWFCANAKLCEMVEVARVYPAAWRQFVSLEKVPNLHYPKWNVYKADTLHDYNEKVQEIITL